MTETEQAIRGYSVTVAPAEDMPGAFTVTYIPRGLQQGRGPGGKPKRVPSDHRAKVRTSGGEAVAWTNPPRGGADLTKFDEDARARVQQLRAWLDSISGLIRSVQSWARELDWSTKLIDKPMDDSAIGSYRVPALLLQKDTTKVLLEPVARTSPGSEGVVDLSLMPGYDDVASLYYYGNRWNIHYMAENTAAVASVREAEGKPLTKASLNRVLDAMTRHAE